MQEPPTLRMGGGARWISNTSSGQGFSLVGLTGNVVMNRSQSRTEAGAGESEVVVELKEQQQEELFG